MCRDLSRVRRLSRLRVLAAVHADQRAEGPTRCGITGERWKQVDVVVFDLQPQTRDDWDWLAAILLDEPDVLGIVA